MKNLFYLVLIDNGFVICSEKDGVAILPHIHFVKTFKAKEEAKRHFVSLTKLNIKKNDFDIVGYIKEEDLYIYSVVVDVNYRDNYLKLQNSGMRLAKQAQFMGLESFNWDNGSRLAIRSLSKNTNYKDAYNIINSDSKFDYYADETRTIIDSIFNDITNIWQYDKPDVIVEKADHIVGLECFQINAAGTNENGSIGSRGHKKMLDKVKKGKLLDANVVSMHFDNSLKKLFKDFCSTFKNHLSKVDIYSKNLALHASGRKQAIGFYVSDTTLLGTYYRPSSGGFSPLYLFNLKEFWDVYLKVDEPLFFIFQQTESDVKNMFFITKNDYPQLMKKKMIWSIADIEEMFFNDPSLIGTSFPLE